MKGSILVVRVKDWVASGKRLPPWPTDKDICNFCGEAVIVTPEYTKLVESLGLEIQYVCTRCFEEYAVSSSLEVS